MKHPIHEASVAMMEKWAEANDVRLTKIPMAYDVFQEKVTATLTSGGDQFDIIWHNDDWGQLWEKWVEPTTDVAGMDKVAQHPLDGQLREGLRYIQHTSEVAWTIVLVATIGLFGLNMPVILAAFADHEFGTGVSGYSLFNSLSAIGALVGALVSARRRGQVRLRVLVSLLTLLGLTIGIAAIAPSVWTFGMVLILSGLLTLQFLTGANSLVQLTTAPAVRGRVMSVYLLVLLGGQAIGSPVVGWLIDHYGARPSMG
jgi:hypothetical protein